ncbi:MAG: LVIVD repeat-containing protein [Solirubrobacteraceae bacterium]
MPAARLPGLAAFAAAVVLASPAHAAGEPIYLGTELARQQSLAAPAPGAQARITAAEPPLTATPRATCGAGSRPEPGLQGRVPAGAVSADGFTCNMTLLSHEGQAGGFKVERFVDKAGHECAYYDTTLVFPLDAAKNAASPSGVAVLDMADPAKPVRTATLQTPAMLSPHESVLVNQKRGLLAAVMGNPTLYPGFVDVYDLNADCRHPVLQSSLPVGLLGHESGWSPDGLTFYATSLFTNMVTAVDMTNPKLPVTLWVGQFPSHGFMVSDDGNRGYIAGLSGLQIVDTSEVQARKPDPQVTEISRLDWTDRSIPQVALPVTIKGTKYLFEIDEFSTGAQGDNLPVGNGPRVGAARLIDISDEKAPHVVSNIRLEVNQREHRAEIAGDPGASFLGQGYGGHYCNVPREVDPGIVACSFILSGLRVFDIRNPLKPREIAYFVAPPADSSVGTGKTDYAMSRPSFVPARGEIWYSDANSGFYALRVAKGVWPFPAKASTPPVRCRSKRVFTIHLKNPRGDHLRSARVTVDGKRVRVRKGSPKFRVRVDLRGKGRKTVVVRVRAVTRSGRVVRETRRYRTCRAGT